MPNNPLYKLLQLKAYCRQKQLRLQDAKQVEAKAARIKEWVTNKLRELEHQNQQLREQNDRCNQQLELLRNHIAASGSRNSTVSSTISNITLINKIYTKIKSINFTENFKK